MERLNAALDGRYRLERELGRGGMAVVYAARDLRHGRSVAIKVLRPELGEAMGPERFLREIEVAARLNHPNILALHDSGEADGLLYFVMPFVEGPSLRDRLDHEGALPLEEATRIVREVGSALAYAHDHGLVHRDVKPENVLFQAGHAMVCDFGIAKIANEAQGRLTRTGHSVGTLAYMSPEQAAGDAEVDARSDVYSLGCLLHEMLDGRPPFSASTPQAILARKLLGEIPDLGASGRNVPRTVQRVIERALTPQPNERFPTATSLVEALDRATTRLAIAEDEQRVRWVRSLRITGTVAAIGLLGLGGWWATTRTRAPAFELVAVLPLANGANDAATDYFVQGVHQDLVLELQQAGLRVINERSVRRYTDSDASVREIADELGADGVVQGSARLSGGSVRMDLELVDPGTQEIVWFRSFASEERDVIRLLGEVTRSIAREVGVELTAEAEARLAGAPEVDPLVYQALLEARYERQKLTAESFERAESYYRLALARDSLSVDAWMGLAGVWNARAQQGLVSAQVAAQNAQPLLARARAIDPDLGQNHAMNAARLTWPEWPAGRWTEAEEAFRNAIRQDPSDATVRVYFALLLLYLGKTDEAEMQTYRAAEQAPDDPLVQGIHGQALNALHRWEEAEAAMTRARRFEPDAPILLSTLRTIYHLMGEHERAIQMWRDSYRSTGDLAALEALNRGYEEGGYYAALRSVAEIFVERRRAARSNEDPEDDDDVRPWQIGTLYTRAGMHEEAIRYLTEAVEEGDPNSPYLSIDAIFDPLRSDRRFQALVDRLGLPDSTR